MAIKDQAARRRVGSRARVAGVSDAPKMKCSFMLDSELDTKLDYHAKRLGKSRSKIVGELIHEATSYIRIQCVGLNGSNATGDGDPEPSETATAA